MQIAWLKIENFRGIKTAEINFDGHTVLIGDNNAGKSTILEAIDLVLGPDRLSRQPIIDEHDFFAGKYLEEDGGEISINIELIIIGLSAEQIRRFKSNLEFWDSMLEMIVDESPEVIDDDSVQEALRVCFKGHYDKEEDDFVGDTFFCSPSLDEGEQQKFRKSDKRECGFLYLRALRTGSRALSMERGSLLDIILRIRDLRPQMWEDILDKLRDTKVAEDDKTEINGVLEEVQAALKKFVPADWGSQPHFKVTDLTRENLRKTLTVFMSTGAESYFAPFHHQGTGTVNTMVLALLSIIAESKQSVIFAMEEPEIAIPPYTQKRIVNTIRKTANQAIFTSHSPFVLEEFDAGQIRLIKRHKGKLTSKSVQLPAIIKPKMYSSEFRLRFAEALLAKRVLITEGTTEAIGYPAAARRLEELKPEKYASFEALGVAIFNAGSENQIAVFGKYFKGLKKETYAVFDKQSVEALKMISDNIDHPYESKHKGMEALILNETTNTALKRLALKLVDDDHWPKDLTKIKPVEESTDDEISAALEIYLQRSKGTSVLADLMALCKLTEVPQSIRDVIKDIKIKVEEELEL